MKSLISIIFSALCPIMNSKISQEMYYVKGKSIEVQRLVELIRITLYLTFTCPGDQEEYHEN